MKKYEVIYEHLLNDILSGTIPLGTQLQSEAFYQEKFDCSRFTIRNSLSLLEQNGYISRTKGKPSTVINNTPQRKTILFLTQFMGQYVFGDLVYKIEKKLKANRYNTIISFSYSNLDFEKQNLENLISIADGIIIDPTHTYTGFCYENSVYKQLENKPSVSISSPIPEINIPYIVVNDFEVMFNITNKLIKKNNERFLIIAREIDFQGYQRFLGIKTALTNAGLDFDLITIENEDSLELNQKIMSEHLKNNYDTIMFYNDQIAYSFISFSEKGKHSIDSLTITGFDGIDNVDTSKEIISPILPIDQMSTDIVTMIVSLFDNKPICSLSYELDIKNDHLLN